MKKLMGIFLLSLTGSLLAATMGIDDASNYDFSSFTNGANGGTGFQIWDIAVNGSGGIFLGDSTDGNCGDINTTSGSTSQSFGMWGNPAGGNSINCNRKFAGSALSAGQKFSAKLGVNWRNGNKGIDILSSDQVIFNFNVGGDKYTYSPTNHPAIDLGWAYSENSVIDLVIEQKLGNVLNVDLTRGTDNFNQDFTLTGNADEFKLYCADTDAGSANNNFYANSISIIPEPVSIFLILLGLGLMKFRK